MAQLLVEHPLELEEVKDNSIESRLMQIKLMCLHVFSLQMNPRTEFSNLIMFPVKENCRSECLSQIAGCFVFVARGFVSQRYNKSMNRMEWNGIDWNCME